MNIYKTKLTWQLCTKTLLLYLIISRDQYASAQEDLQAIADKGHKMYLSQNLDEAYQYWKEGLEFAKKEGEKSAISLFANNLGFLCRRQLKFNKAIEYLNIGIDIDTEINDKEGLAKGFQNLGNVYLDLGNFSKSLVCYKQALSFAEDIVDIESIGALNVNMAAVYIHMGRLDEAQASLDTTKEDFMDNIDNTTRGLWFTNQAIVNFMKGETLSTTINLLGASEIFLAERNFYELAKLYLNEGKILFSEKDYEGAEARFRFAMQLSKNSGIITYSAANGLADIYRERGMFEEAKAIYETSDNFVGMGIYFLNRKDYVNAEKSFRKAIIILEGVKRLPVMFPVYTGLGLALEGNRKFSEAETYFIKACDIVENGRTFSDGEGKLNFYGAQQFGFSRIDPYEGLVRVCRRLPNKTGDAQFYSEFTRARAFVEAIAERNKIGTTMLPYDLAAKEEELNENLFSLNAQLNRANECGESVLVNKTEEELKLLNKERQAFIVGLRKSHPQYASTMYPLPDHAEGLPLLNDEIVLQFEVTETVTVVFLIESGKVIMSYEIPVGRKALHKMIENYRKPFENVISFADLARYDPILGNKLFKLLLEPAFMAKGKNQKPLVSKSSKLTIIPDEILGILPFESLVISYSPYLEMAPGKHGQVPLGVKYVVDDYDIAYYQSTTVLRTQRSLLNKPPAIKPLFVLADPVFDLTDSRLRGTKWAKGTLKEYPSLADEKDVRQMGVGGHRGESDKKRAEANTLFPRLDKTSLMVDVLRNRIFTSESVDSLSGVEANERTVKETDLFNYRYIVFATHGILDNTLPSVDESSLVLNQVGNDDSTDGFLKMSEVMTLKLNAEFIALTACQTGMGRNISGEGVLGMGRAFQYAGAKSVLVSLWSVSEDSTTLMAEKIFTYLKQGKTNRKAIQLARADVRQAGYEHPFFWAPFILIGE